MISYHIKLRRGLITSDSNDGVLLIADGLAVGMDDLARMPSIHEGWEFELSIVDALA